MKRSPETRSGRRKKTRIWSGHHFSLNYQHGATQPATCFWKEHISLRLQAPKAYPRIVKVSSWVMENYGTATWHLEFFSPNGAVKLHKRNLEIHHYTHNTLEHGPFTRPRDSEKECPRDIFWKVIDGALRQKDSRIFLGKTDFPNALWQAFPTNLLTGDINVISASRKGKPSRSKISAFSSQTSILQGSDETRYLLKLCNNSLACKTNWDKILWFTCWGDVTWQADTYFTSKYNKCIPNNARLYKATKHFCSTVKVSLTKNRSLDCLLSNSLVAKGIQGMSQLISLCPAASKVPIRIIVEASSL